MPAPYIPAARKPPSTRDRESMPFRLAVSAVSLLLVFAPEIVLLVPDLIIGKNLR